MREEGPSVLISFAVLLCLLAASLFAWLFCLEPASSRAAERFALRDRILDAIRVEEEEGHTLTVMRECLENDPQTIERELRDRGFGRDGDAIWMIVGGDDAPHAR